MKDVLAYILLGITLLVVDYARAETIGHMTNNAGGQIVFTDEDCLADNDYLRVIGTTPSGTTIDGCWSIETNSTLVRVMWTHTNGQPRARSQWSYKMYDANELVLTAYGQRLARQPSSRARY